MTRTVSACFVGALLGATLVASPALADKPAGEKIVDGVREARKTGTTGGDDLGKSIHHGIDKHVTPAAFVLPLTPLVEPLGFVVLPATAWIAVLGISGAYVLTVEALKRVVLTRIDPPGASRGRIDR